MLYCLSSCSSLSLAVWLRRFRRKMCASHSRASCYFLGRRINETMLLSTRSTLKTKCPPCKCERNLSHISPIRTEVNVLRRGWCRCCSVMDADYPYTRRICICAHTHMILLCIRCCYVNNKRSGTLSVRGSCTKEWTFWSVFMLSGSRDRTHKLHTHTRTKGSGALLYFFEHTLHTFRCSLIRNATCLMNW